MNYTPHTEEDIARALSRLGLDQVEELFDGIPDELLDPAIDLPGALDETALLARLKELAGATEETSTMMAGGMGLHFTPTVVKHLAMQSEFVTAYTPYQPEVSQGILQATFEFQTMMSELTGLPVSNASMYDGATAAAEAALLAVRHTGRSRVAVSAGVHPQTREVLATYLQPLDVELVVSSLDSDLTTPVPQLADDIACFIAQQPNFLGYLERMEEFAEAANDSGALFIAVVDPLSLALLRPPGDYGAQVAVGDGQRLGNSLSFGGPHFGFMVVAEELLRQLPGRIVGETRDVDGRRAYVLTLQAREQHIRRSRAKSNICSNHQLTALLTTVHLAALGPQGLAEVAKGSVANAHALAERLAGAGFDVRRSARFFNEFTVSLPVDARQAVRELAARGVQAGVVVPDEYGLGDAILLGASELTTPAEMDRLIKALNESCRQEAVAGGRR